VIPDNRAGVLLDPVFRQDNLSGVMTAMLKSITERFEINGAVKSQAGMTRLQCDERKHVLQVQCRPHRRRSNRDKQFCGLALLYVVSIYLRRVDI
jgi:hypothetical protein